MQTSGSEARIGYIGVDVLNNATICNETTALLERDVPLDLVSVYNIQKATFYRNETLKILDGRIHHLYPLKPLAMAWGVLRAPFVFGGRFFTMVWKALTGKVEGPRQRMKMLGHLLPAIKLAYHWQNRNVNHVHCQWAHTATTIGMHAAELLGIGFSFMGHANDLFVHRVALDDKVKRARYILCISEYHRRFYLDMGADSERLHVVYCGVSLDRFQENKPFNPAVRRIVSVGRLVEKKGFDDLIRSCGILRDRGVEFECVIAGSGPEEANLNQLIDELDLRNSVSITG
ncbi:MAG: glycosyltransferase, partial [Planctomycetota bacterium]